MAVSDLAKRFDASYMTVKQHCEDLTKRGYLKRTRVPRSEIGRPEIFYSLSEKAQSMFPPLPPKFTLDMFDQIQRMFGETAPDKLLFQYFQEQEKQWKAKVDKGEGLLAKSQLFVKTREKEGAFFRCIDGMEKGGLILREFHNPLYQFFEKFPRAIAMEQRAIEAALGVRLTREAHMDGSGQATHVDFVLHQ